MPEFLSGWPFWALLSFMFGVAFLRGQATYWLARGITRASLQGAPDEGWRGRMAAWLDSPGVDHGANVLRRFGIVAVPLCYLTVGLQTAVLASAGVLRLHALVFTLAQIPGAVAWAVIYSTIGWAIWEAALFTAAGSPWGIAAIALVIGLLIWFVARRTREGHRARTSRRGPDHSPLD